MKALFGIFLMILLFGDTQTTSVAKEKPVVIVNLEDTILRLQKQSLITRIHNTDSKQELQVIALKGYIKKIISTSK